MSLYKRILSKFPSNIIYSFAYGSGVKKQVGYESLPKSSSLIDFIFCVREPLKWHQQNIQQNPSHYSGLRYFGEDFILGVQENLGAKVYFNTLVPLPEEGVVIKYGLISAKHLIDDLNDWTHLYISGRLHKPVEVVTEVNCDDITAAVQNNLASALRASMLLLPAKFSKFHLFYTISNLSYSGDFRMIFGENKDKVHNIVTPQLEDFFELYKPALRELRDYIAISKDCSTFEQDKSPKSNEKHIQNLPKNLQAKVIWNSRIRAVKADVFHQLATRRDHAELVAKSINQIVWRSSVFQSIKNIPTAGIIKSLRYSWKKALKTFNL